MTGLTTPTDIVVLEMVNHKVVEHPVDGPPYDTLTTGERVDVIHNLNLTLRGVEQTHLLHLENLLHFYLLVLVDFHGMNLTGQVVIHKGLGKL